MVAEHWSVQQSKHAFRYSPSTPQGFGKKVLSASILFDHEKNRVCPSGVQREFDRD